MLSSLLRSWRELVDDAIACGSAGKCAAKHVLIRQLGGEPAYATEIASKIAHGDLAVNVQLRSGDQDSLLYEIKSMRDSLAAIVGKVRAGTLAIDTASSEIAAGNDDMANRTAHQASSLEKVATAMEELTSTVRQNASNAQQANTLAQTAPCGWPCRRCRRRFRSRRCRSPVCPHAPCRRWRPGCRWKKWPPRWKN